MTKKKFNVIDVIIIATIILIIAAVSYRAVFIGNLGNKSEEKTVSYTVTVPGIDSIYAHGIQIGDEVYLENGSEYCGNVSSVKTVYASSEVVYPDGSVKSHILPNKINLTVTVEITARTSDEKLFLGGSSYISAGETAVFYTETFTFAGIVSDIITK